LNNEYSIYICGFEQQETLFSRHFLTGIAPCRKIASNIQLSKIGEILDRSLLEALVDKEEVVVTEPSIIHKILVALGVAEEKIEEVLSSPYLYVLIKKN